ncbi:MAG: 2-oxoglutarate and iron-dependent oxygenase domain-containing protein [Actinomycetota bacterium]
MTAFEVPVIDVSAWGSGDADARERIAAAVDDAARHVGFLQIVGHGVPDDVVDDLTVAMDRFFALPLDEKVRYVAPPEINRGYAPPRSERLSYSLGVASPEDLFEAFNVGTACSDHPDHELDPAVYPENLWPELADFRPAVETWFVHARDVARMMASIFATALDLAADHFEPFTDHGIEVLRMNHYDVPPDVELVEGQQGMGAHTDYGIVTVLWADPVPGLEILDGTGRWHPVRPVDGALLVNLGDLLARWTNDRWISTMHRVVPPRDDDGRLIRRRSAAFFFDGNADGVVSTLPTCRDETGGSAYPDVTVAEHLAQKLGGSRGLDLNEHADREASRLGG